MGEFAEFEPGTAEYEKVDRWHYQELGT